jgi:hypothetical protein
MSEDAQRQYLVNKMQNGWNSFLKTAYPNLAFNIPTEEPYAEFHIASGPKPVGFVQLTVWIPNKKGTKPATLAGDKFKEIFQFKKGRDLACQTYKFGILQPMTPETKAGWECLVYRVPFERDTVERVQISIND